MSSPATSSPAASSPATPSPATPSPATLTPRFAFFDGRVLPYGEARVGLLTHALHYGTGVFAGIRAYWNPDERRLLVFRLRDHLRRLRQSASILRMRLPLEEDAIADGICALLRAEGIAQDAYVRAIAFYRDERIGIGLAGLQAALAVVAVPMGSYVPNDDGAHVTVSSWRRVSDAALPARGKITGSYANAALARSDAQLAGFDEALMLDEDGHVSEGSGENVFLRRGDVVITPPVTGDILEGITRRTVVALLGEELGVRVVERPIDRSELFVADELFLTGTAAQIVAVTRVDHRPVGDGRQGAVTARLRRLYDDVVRGRSEKHRLLCTPISAGPPGAAL